MEKEQREGRGTVLYYGHLCMCGYGCAHVGGYECVRVCVCMYEYEYESVWVGVGCVCEHEHVCVSPPSILAPLLLFSKLLPVFCLYHL